MGANFLAIYIATWVALSPSANPILVEFIMPSTIDSNPEYQVNTETVGHQYSSQVSALSDGGYVIAWQSIGQDGDGHGVYAQRYGVDGQPAGNEFRVSEVTTGEQMLSAVETTADGGFVIVWSSNTTGDDYYLSKYNANGVKVGSTVDLPFDTYDGNVGNSEATKFTSDIVALDDGRFIVLWTGDDTSGTGYMAKSITLTLRLTAPVSRSTRQRAVHSSLFMQDN